MEPATPSPTSEPPAWEAPDWLMPEAELAAVQWWEAIEVARAWPDSFIQAFMHGYVAGYERGQRRRKVDGSEDEPTLPPPKLPAGDEPGD